MRLPEPAPKGKLGFDISQLRLAHDYNSASTEWVQTTIPVGKPRALVFFRAHPEWTFPAATLTHEDHVYLVAGALRQALEGDLKVKIIVPCITRDGDIFQGPLGQLLALGRTDAWTASAHRALFASRQRWIRMRSNKQIGSYEIIRSRAVCDEPTWPEQTLEQMLETAFTDSVISTLDHPVIRALQGDL